MSFPVTLWRGHRNARAVHEDDLPDASLFLEEGRFEPFLAHGARGVRDAALIDVCNPTGIAADVAVGFRHVPLVAFTRRMLGFEHGDDGIPVESDAPVVDVKVCCNAGSELRAIVRARCSEYHAHCVYDLSLVGGEEVLLRARGRDVRRKEYLETTVEQYDAAL